MIDLNKEAEEYVLNIYLYGEDSVEFQQAKTDFIAGANSKHVEQKILEAQIDIYSSLLRRSDDHYSDMGRYMIKKVEELRKQLEELTK